MPFARSRTLYPPNGDLRLRGAARHRRRYAAYRELFTDGTENLDWTTEYGTPGVYDDGDGWGYSNTSAAKSLQTPDVQLLDGDQFAQAEVFAHWEYAAGPVLVSSNRLRLWCRWATNGLDAEGQGVQLSVFATSPSYSSSAWTVILYTGDPIGGIVLGGDTPTIAPGTVAQLRVRGTEITAALDGQVVGSWTRGDIPAGGVCGLGDAGQFGTQQVLARNFQCGPGRRVITPAAA